MCHWWWWLECNARSALECVAQDGLAAVTRSLVRRSDRRCDVTNWCGSTQMWCDKRSNLRESRFASYREPDEWCPAKQRRWRESHDVTKQVSNLQVKTRNVIRACNLFWSLISDHISQGCTKFLFWIRIGILIFLPFLSRQNTLEKVRICVLRICLFLLYKRNPYLFLYSDVFLSIRIKNMLDAKKILGSVLSNFLRNLLCI